MTCDRSCVGDGEGEDERVQNGRYLGELMGVCMGDLRDAFESGGAGHAECGAKRHPAVFPYQVLPVL